MYAQELECSMATIDIGFFLRRLYIKHSDCGRIMLTQNGDAPSDDMFLLGLDREQRENTR